MNPLSLSLPALFFALVSGLFYPNLSESQQTASSCAARLEYRVVCEGLEPTSRCSPQLTDLCCGCEGFWGADLSYCRFSGSLYPVPTPTIVPTVVPTVGVRPVATPPLAPTATPHSSNRPPVFDLPTDSGSGPVQCHVLYDHEASSCGPIVQLAIDGSRSRGQRPVWQAHCTSADGSYESRLLTNGKVARLELNEPVAGREVECTVRLRVSGRDERRRVVSRECGTKVLVNSCSLGCRSHYIPSELHALDSRALDASRLVRRIAKITQTVPGGRALAKSLRGQADQAYHRAWVATWSLPFLFKTCASVSCQAVVHTQSLTTLSTESVRLYELARQGAARVIRLGSAQKRRSVNKLLKRAAKIRNDNLAAARNLPTEQSVCR